MADTLAPGVRSLPPVARSVATPAFDLAGFGIPGFGEQAPRTGPDGRGEEAATPVIDWNAGKPVAAAAQTTTRDWVGDFLNHLGKREAERNPNLDLRIALPTASEVSAKAGHL